MTPANQLTEISKTVAIIYSKNPEEPQLTQLVNLIQKVSLSYLKYQELMGRKLRQYKIKNGQELEDLALDCVAGLFIRNNKNEFTQLKKYFGHNKKDFYRLSEGEVLVLLRRLVVKKTKQELCRIFRERDPERAKILRNIRLSIKTTSDFHSFKEVGREYLCFDQDREDSGKQDHFVGDEEVKLATQPRSQVRRKDENRVVRVGYLRKGQPEIPEEVLLQDYLNIFYPRDTVPACIRKMLTIVRDDRRYRNYLPLDTAAKIIYKTNTELAHYRLQSQNIEFSPLDHLHLKEIEECKLLVSRQLKKKIETQYVKSNKISEQKGKSYYKALADALEDIGRGEKIESYFRYLCRHMPSLTQEKYRQQERTIFEYLGKVMKNWLRKSLIELL